MVIWLSRPGHAHIERGTSRDTLRIGLTDDIVPRETFGILATLEAVHSRAEAEYQAILAAAYIERDQVIRRANEEAEAIVTSAQQERERATELGYAEGVVRGEALWIDRIADLSAGTLRLQKGMRNRMVELVMLAVEQLVRVENAQDLFARATDAIDRIVDGAANLRVNVHPDDIDAANAAFDGFAARLRSLGRPVSISVTADPKLTRGACVCESDLGIVDAGLSTQLSSMRAAMVRALNTSLKTVDSVGFNDEQSMSADIRNRDC
ncbi:type III secretion system stator protein SctL [Burkholderia metallica]|uniref:type III secretion system stator protein SctL n=1 Tax=Burkholderia metallica TaxID=488729 RepID=UPI001CF46709|nr:type III secretion system stator protein SctL [Burkholderia metallica]MCA8002722.1 type III secretion system stator protein SctL [Burkholderia metallica]